jgi:hypothetical protein
VSAADPVQHLNATASYVDRPPPTSPTAASRSPPDPAQSSPVAMGADSPAQFVPEAPTDPEDEPTLSSEALRLRLRLRGPRPMPACSAQLAFKTPWDGEPS